MSRNDTPTALGEVPCVAPKLEEIRTLLEDSIVTALTATDTFDSTEKGLAAWLAEIRNGLVFRATPEGGGSAVTLSVGAVIDGLGGTMRDRLVYRGFTIEAAGKMVEALKFIGEAIGERLAQQTQFEAGSDEIPDSSIPFVEPVDAALDAPPMEP